MEKLKFKNTFELRKNILTVGENIAVGSYTLPFTLHNIYKDYLLLYIEITPKSSEGLIMGARNPGPHLIQYVVESTAEAEVLAKRYSQIDFTEISTHITDSLTFHPNWDKFNSFERERALRVIFSFVRDKYKFQL